MTQSDLDREIARATGETGTIRNLGFSLVEMPEPEPRNVDWHDLAKSRVTSSSYRPRQYAAAA